MIYIHCIRIVFTGSNVVVALHACCGCFAAKMIALAYCKYVVKIFRGLLRISFLQEIQR